MPTLLSLMENRPEPVRAAVDALQVNAIAVITLGFQGVDERQFTAVYFPDPEYLVNRASAPGVFSPRNAPEGCFSIQAEITCRQSDAILTQRDDDLIDHVLTGLIRFGIVRPEIPLVFTDVQRYQYAYVVYTVGYEEHVRTVRSWAESQGIHLHGRFGAFEYLNVDGCVMRSLELAVRLNGRPTSLGEIETDEEVPNDRNVRTR
jgi:protoporphyrinogen oxidase